MRTQQGIRHRCFVPDLAEFTYPCLSDQLPFRNLAEKKLYVKICIKMRSISIEDCISNGGEQGFYLLLRQPLKILTYYFKINKLPDLNFYRNPPMFTEIHSSWLQVVANNVNLHSDDQINRLFPIPKGFR